MAKHPAKNVKEFVKRNQFDDLKIRPGTPQNGSTRPNKQAQRLSHENRRMTRSASNGQLPPVDAQINKPFYDTDASAASKNSTVGPTHHDGHANASRPHSRLQGRPQQDAPPLDGAKYVEEEFEEEFEVEASGSDDGEIPNDPLPGQDRSTGDGLGRLEGDTYPETTSGQPSIADAADYQGQQAAQMQAQSAQPTHQALLARGSGTRMPINAQTSNMVSRENQSHLHLGRPMPPHQPLQPHPSADVAGLVSPAGFSFALAPKHGASKPNAVQQTQSQILPKPTPLEPTPQLPAANVKLAAHPERRRTAPNEPPNPPHEQQPRQDRPQTSNRRHTAHPQRSQSPLMQQQQRQSPQLNLQAPTDQDQPSDVNGQIDPTVPRGSSRVEQMQYEQPSREQPSHEQPTYQQQPREQLTKQRYPQQGYPQQQYTQQQYPQQQYQQSSSPPLDSGVELDFEEDELYKMDFDDLKKANFDNGPDPDVFELPGEQNEGTLQQKLNAVKSMAPRDQQQFFMSLDIEQWEDAGDWFVERFGEILQKFKAARREKRKAAHEFEHHVEERHVTVEKKRKLTHDALGEMKESGGKVLQGTPTKAMKRK